MSSKGKPGSTPIGTGSAEGETSSDRIDHDQASRLIHLLHLANDLCLAYRTAVRRLDDAKLRDELGAMDRSHDRLRAQLGDLIENLGHTPVATGDLHGLIERGRVVVGGWQGDEGILRAMANNEEELNAALREELHQSGLSAKATAAMEEALELGSHHRQYYNQELKIFVG